MNLRLDPSTEQLIEQQLRTGRYRSPEEIVARALEVLVEKESTQPEAEQTCAVDEMLNFTRKYSFKLGRGLRPRDLVHEGHRY